MIRNLLVRESIRGRAVFESLGYITYIQKLLGKSEKGIPINRESIYVYCYSLTDELAHNSGITYGCIT